MIGLASVNVSPARPLRVGGQTVLTGIEKRPVAGPVRVGSLGLEGDAQGDPKNHGGPDQAVYLYGLDDYAAWAMELGADLEPGMFGENLTVTSLGPEPRVGDRLRIWPVLLELTAPRIPCGKLAARMGDPGFVKRFAGFGRPGAYARVLETGEIEAGARIERTPAPEAHPTLLDLFRLWYDASSEEGARRHANRLRRALDCPALATRARAAYELMLGRAA